MEGREVNGHHWFFVELRYIYLDVFEVEISCVILDTVPSHIVAEEAPKDVAEASFKSVILWQLQVSINIVRQKAGHCVFEILY